MLLNFHDFGHILKINCPSLKCFDSTGFVDCVEAMNLSSLTDVTFNLRCRNIELKEFRQFMAVLKKLQCAKALSSSCEFVIANVIPILGFLVPHSKYAKIGGQSAAFSSVLILRCITSC